MLSTFKKLSCLSLLLAAPALAQEENPNTAPSLPPLIDFGNFTFEFPPATNSSTPPIDDGETEGSGEDPVVDPVDEEAKCGFLEDGSVDYSQGGANWCGKCKNGENQSPISTPVYVRAPDLVVDSLISFGDVRRGRVVALQNWVELFFRSDGALRLEGTRQNEDFQLKYKPTGYARFHTPAEHAFSNGDPYDLELEIFFTDKESGDQAIVSTFWDRELGGTRRSDFIDGLGIDELDIENNSTSTNADILFTELFQGLGNSSLVMYNGSLSVPPCTENVQRILYDSPQSISYRQLRTFRSYFKNNNRMLQDLTEELLYGRLDVSQATCPCSE